MSLNLWNELNLPLPPNSLYKTSRDKFDYQKFSEVIRTTLDFFRNTEKFHNEVAQLSRFIFLNCKQFRMMKGLHEMKKSHQALLRYLNLDFVTVLENFNGIITDENETRVSLPHRQSLDFILIRLQGLGKLLLRVVRCCKNSARYFLGLIKAGSFYMKGVILLGTLARIWDQSRDICKFIVRQYDELMTFRPQIKVKPGVGWVGESCELPTNLEAWLGDDFHELVAKETFDRRLLLRHDDIEKCLQQLDGDHSSVLKRIRTEDTDKNFAESEAKKIKIEENSGNLLNDFTPIPRNIKTEVKSEDISEHSFFALTSKNAITNFIKNETFYRKAAQQKSLTTSKMSKKVWKEFKDDIKNKSVLMQDGAFVSYVNDYLEEYKT